jgi:hypothetical protein
MKDTAAHSTARWPKLSKLTRKTNSPKQLNIRHLPSYIMLSIRIHYTANAIFYDFGIAI